MDKYWRIFEDSFCKQERTQGRIKKPVMDFFLVHTLAAESGELVSLSELYAEYKKYTKRKDGQTVAQELASLTGYAWVQRVDRYASFFSQNTRRMLNFIPHLPPQNQELSSANMNQNSGFCNRKRGVSTAKSGIQFAKHGLPILVFQ